MDDNRTDKTLDALADLFLTGGPRRSAVATGQPMARPAAVSLDGPAPIRLPPKPGVLKAGSSTLRTDPPHKPYEQDIIGTIRPSQDGRPPRQRIAPPAHSVEAVFLGNLPGFGGPWLTQYAHWLAQRHGPVAVIHVDDEQIDVELVSTPDDPSLPPAERTASLHGGAAGSDALLDCLHDLTQLDPAPVRTWLVHLPAPLTDAGVARARQFERWTVLCGADDAAVVSGYQLLKQLVDGEAADAGEAADPRGSRRRVGLMIMGSDMTASRAAARRVNDAAGSFLETPVTLLGAVKQMAPLSQRQCGGFTDPASHWPTLRTFLEALPGQPTIELEPAHPSEPTDGQRARATPVLDEARRPAAPRVAPSRQEAPAKPAAPAVQEPPTQPRPTAPASADTPNLATYVPGSIALQARCPRHPDCVLALDEDGRVHLLLHSTADSPANAVVALLETRGWVREHAELLRMTQRQCHFDADAAPVAHLFTDQAKAAARLAAHGAAELHIHLLERIRLGGQSTWYCTELT